MMHFDLSGAELCLDYLDGKAAVRDVFEHPAYRVVRKHAETFSSALTEADIEAAVRGQPSNFFGLKGVAENTPKIRAFLEILRKNQGEWAGLVQEALRDFFRDETLNIPIYPILGYDKGIGLNGAVCLNINYAPYLEEPFEFLAFVIHECVHVIYERHHRVPPLAEIVSPAQWRAYFALWTQNEGYAVYVPLAFRQNHGILTDSDYRVLFEPAQLDLHRVAFLETLQWLDRDEPHTRDEYLETCFGSARLTYRVGCEIIRRIEQTSGRTAAREAFYLEGERFVEQHVHSLRNMNK